MIVLRRILSNFLDLLFFILFFGFSFIISGIEVNMSNADFFYVLTFIFIVLIPILINNNTLGKSLVGLIWKENKSLKGKLLIKYLIYFNAFFPSLSFFSLLRNFPYFENSETVVETMLITRIFIVFLLTDIIIFIIYLGEFHLIDFALKLNLVGSKLKRNKVVILSGFVFTFIFLFSTVLTYRNNFSKSNLNTSIKSKILYQYYPKDDFGDYLIDGNVIALKSEDSRIFSSAEPLSFVTSINLKYKTFYVLLNDKNFNSIKRRLNLCYKLLSYSLENDVFDHINFDQIRFVLINSKNEFVYLNRFQYYVYYLDYKNIEWGIYGGVNTDSLTVNNYYSVFNKMITRNKDSLVSISSSLYENQIEISLDTFKLKLNRVSFKDKAITGYLSANFPIKDNLFIKLENIFNDEIIGLDDEMEYLYDTRENTLDRLLAN